MTRPPQECMRNYEKYDQESIYTTRKEDEITYNNKRKIPQKTSRS